ncbi:MAG: DUF2339 domain-containing protein, partial [Treponema sp.]|nr:DUF2339 domain-containing protein [Treponema sp.]
PEDRNRFAGLPIVLGIWAFIWWFGGWTYEIYRALENPRAVLFLFCSVSALAAFGAAQFLRTPVYRIGMIPALAMGLYLPLETFLTRFPRFVLFRPRLILSYNFFTGPFLWGWLAFFAVQALLLFGARKSFRQEVHGLWLLIVTFIALGVLSSSGRALTLSRELAPAWTSLAGMAPLFLTMAGIGLTARRIWPQPDAMGGDLLPKRCRLWTIFPRSLPMANSNAISHADCALSGGEPPQRPPASPPTGFRKKLFLFVLPLILSCIMGIWFIVTLFLSGDPAPLPVYIPFINPLDLEEAFCIVLFLLWQSVLSGQGDLPKPGKPVLFILIDTVVFLFTIAVTARSVHFYGGVPYRLIFNSDLFHLCLFILWAVYGIGHIIVGSRRSLRKVWIAGAVLTVADIAKLLFLDLAGTGALTRIVSFFIAGLLLLFIGWAAPLPPAAGKETTVSPEQEEQGQTHAE